MATVQTKSRGQRLVLDCVDWRTYERLLRAFGERRSVRLTYDRGTLEIVNIADQYGSAGHLLPRMVALLTEELDIPIAGGGSTTIRRQKKRRGLEPDECFWIAHEAEVRRNKDIDLRIDPPPDLALEVDLTRSSLNRMRIYAGLGVPELWRHDGQTLTFHVLGPDGKYGPDVPSTTFPGLRAAVLMPFLALHGQIDQTTLMRQFRDWVRQQIAAGVLTRPNP